MGGFKPRLAKAAGILLAAFSVFNLLTFSSVLAATQQQSGSVGLEGTVPSNPPSRAPTITIPSNGQVFNSVPITVAGLCQSNLLVEVFKNGVFSGSVECSNGNYSLKIDLFEGRNDLVARQYDALNQASPDSNTVSVTFNNNVPANVPRLSIFTAYAKRGATPGETLTWPITISGGTPPYAISINWGDKSAPDLISQPAGGNINLEHVYAQSGVYNITIQATDANGAIAFLQVVGVGNGPIQQTTVGKNGIVATEKTKVLWWPIIVLFVMMLVSYWLGQKHQLETIRSRLRKGDRPF